MGMWLRHGVKSSGPLVSAVSAFALLMPLLLVLLVLLAGRTAQGALDSDALRLVWYDEFDGAQVDWDKWVVDEGDGCDVDLCDWGNGERQYYRTENAGVADGNLLITAKKEEYSSRFYTSSKITTKNRYAFRYGRAEARIKLPTGGQGLWPAFWMMPQDNAYGKWAASGELDIFESRNNLTEVTNNLNFGNAFPNNSNYNGDCTVDVPQGTLQEFHTYAVEWDAEEIVWFMDDDETCRKDYWFSTDVKTGEEGPQPAPFDQDFYLVLNLAVGGNDEYVGEGPVNDSVLPAEMAVDFVRVYQTPEQFGEGPVSPYVRNATGGGARHGVLLWEDDFTSTYNGSQVSSDWEVIRGNDLCLSGSESSCLNEIQAFHTAQAVAEGGTLSITVKEEETTADGSVYTARSGLIRTEGSVSFSYGRLEATLAMPTVPGVVSALSLLPATDTGGGQVDVVAAEGGVITGGLWYPAADATEEAGSSSNVSCVAPAPMSGDGGNGSAVVYDSSTFYVCAVEWTEDRFRWYVGGIQYCEVTKEAVLAAGGSWPFDQEMYISLGAAVGRDPFGSLVPVTTSSLPTTLLVQSVRVYRFADIEGTPLQDSATRYVREGTLAWQDEFDGVELDEAAAEAAGEGILGLEYWWIHQEGDGCEMNLCGFGNGEAQWYRKENTGVRDGQLMITAKAEAYAGNIYTSAKMSTNMTVVIKYGRIETRVKLPKAIGLWPSIWLLPQDSPYGGWAAGGAIDILQARNLMDRVHGQLVFGGEYPDVDNLDIYEGGHCYSDLYDDFSEAYHVFALEWEEDVFRWYVDDILYCERRSWYSREGPGTADFPFPAPFDTGFYLIMNIAVGGTFTGGLIDQDALKDEPQMLVDYIRVYNFDGQSVEVADPPEGDGGSGDRSSGAPSLFTAVSVLIVLGVLFSLCMIISCIAKAKSRKSERELMRGDSVHSGTTDIAPTTPNKWSVPRPPSGISQAGLTPPTATALPGATTTTTTTATNDAALHDSATATTQNTALPSAPRPKLHTVLRDTTPGSSSSGGGSGDWVSNVVLIGGEAVPTALAPTKNEPLRRPSGGGGDGGVEDQGVGASKGFGSRWRRTPRPPSGCIPEDWVNEDDAPQLEVQNVDASIISATRQGGGGGGEAVRETHRAAETGVNIAGTTKTRAAGGNLNGAGAVIHDSGIAHGKNTTTNNNINNNNNNNNSSSSSPASSNGFSFFSREDEEAVEGMMEEKRQGPDLALSRETGDGTLAGDRFCIGHYGEYPGVDTGLNGEGLGDYGGFTPSSYRDDDDNDNDGTSRGFSDRRAGKASRTATKAAGSAVDGDLVLETSGERTNAGAASAAAAAADVFLRDVDDDDDDGFDNNMPPQLSAMRIDASNDPSDGGGLPTYEDLAGMQPLTRKF